jgi:tetratricopeptide (TPR) repeat protein
MSGLVVTFYSYKGGVGRSFALANTAVILAQWGLRVLVVDWDIEAPGLIHYFDKQGTGSSPGVIDFLQDVRGSTIKQWDHYTQKINISDCRGELTLMPAAQKSGADYTRVVQELNWDELYTECNLGDHLEQLREKWINHFDIVFIDSRTGVTDFSGITTVQLPDFLVFFFTANKQSLLGCCDIARRAMEARKKLPIDRPALIPIPIPARFELREEYDRANAWRTQFADALSEFFQVWAPKGLEPSILIDNLLIPYVPRWSFGEELAALLEPAGANGIRSASYPISFALETLAALIANRLQRLDLFAVSRDEFVLTARSQAIDESAQHKSLKKRVFISYSRRDEAVANNIMRALNDANLDVWFDRKLLPGDAFHEQIIKNLNESDALIVVLSDRASKWQSEEIEAFIRRSLRGQAERPVIPVVLPGAMPALRESRFLSRIQAFEIRENVPIEVQAENLANRLLGILDPTATKANIEQQRHEMFAQIELGTGLEKKGEFREAIAIYQKALRKVETLTQAEFCNEFQFRDLAFILEKIGDAFISCRDVTQALREYELALEMSKRVASDNRGDRGSTQNIATINSKIGQALFSLGDLAAAQIRVEEAFHIFRRLESEAPQNTVVRRSVLASLVTLGDISAAKGDLVSAARHFEEALVIARNLSDSQGGNEHDRRDIAILCRRVGDVLRAQGDLTAALARYEECLDILRQIASVDLQGSEYLRDIVVCLNNIGDVLRARGDIDSALSYFKESLVLSQRLAGLDPTDRSVARDLFVAYNNLGDALRSQGRLSQALEYYEESLSLMKQVERLDPENAQVQRDLMICYMKLSDMQRIEGDISGALDSSTSGVKIAELLAKSDPGNAAIQRDLALSYSRLGAAQERLGQRDAGIESYRLGQELVRRIMKFSSDDASLSSELSRLEEGIARLEHKS